MSGVCSARLWSMWFWVWAHLYCWFSNPLAFRLDNVLRFADDILKNAQLEFSSLYRCLHVYELLSKEKV